ncbi:MAG: AAA family ATPase [Verrucomicrobiales bacterium]|nr:AAA family ATPase [Verrucomicrobiales bacterium]
MGSHHYPILTWQDASGWFTASLVGDLEGAAANGSTPEEAVLQLKELLDWRVDHEPWAVDSEVREAVLIEVKVEVRPQYRHGARIIPCPETLFLRVPCVTGKQDNGLLLCVVPHLPAQFNYQDHSALPNLVAHYVKESLRDVTPEQLASSFPSARCRLETLPIPSLGERVRRVMPVDRPELKLLFTVADPLLYDVGRKRHASAAYGREQLSEVVARKLGKEKANVLLVGECGVGKTTLLLDSAKRMTRMERASSPTESGKDQSYSDAGEASLRCWRGSGGRLISGMRFLGEWEERCEALIAQLKEIDGIFCAESLLELLQVGGQGAGDSVAAFLLPYLERGELRMVAEATPEEVLACRRLLPGLLDVFQIVPVPLFDESTAELVLQRVASTQAATAQLDLEVGVPALVFRLFKRYQPYTAFPGHAANFLRRLIQAPPTGAPSRKTVTAGDVIAQFAQLTGLPEVFLRDESLLPIEQVRNRLVAEIVGQPDAVTAGSRLLVSIKTGLTDPSRPLGVLLFCGPTGVGKTALAKALVEFCFGSNGAKDRLVRLDMSEYSGWGSAQRFLQGENGRPASWIESVRRQPFCVVLFDELEKAAPEIFDIMLGLMDEGRLTDRFGRITWFRSAIVVMTSNLGASTRDSAGFGIGTEVGQEAEVTKFFRPEFFNRLDEVITFKALGAEDVKQIARKELSELAAREGLAAANLKVTWSDRVVSSLARDGYDHRFGARPLQRVIESQVAVRLAEWRMAWPKARNRTLHLDLDEEGRVSILDRATEP